MIFDLDIDAIVRLHFQQQLNVCVILFCLIISANGAANSFNLHVAVAVSFFGIPVLIVTFDTKSIPFVIRITFVHTEYRNNGNLQITPVSLFFSSSALTKYQRNAIVFSPFRAQINRTKHHEKLHFLPVSERLCISVLFDNQCEQHGKWLPL